MKCLQYQSSSLVDDVFQLCVLADFLFVLLITERGMLNSSPVIVDLPISLFSLISFCCKYFETLLSGAYTFRMAVSSW